MPRSAARQERAVARGQDGSQVGGFRAGRSVADPVYAWVFTKQGPAPQPRCDLPARYSGPQELPTSDDAVPSLGDLSEFLLHCPVQGTHLVP